MVIEQTNDLVQAIEKNENDEYFRRLGEWNCTPSSWDTTNDDARSTYSTYSTLSTYSDDTIINFKPMTEKETNEVIKNYDYSHLWYAKFIKDGELTLSMDEFQEEFRKRFIYPKFPKDEYYDN